jgi:mannose-1-phosphate guanylyltransferase
VELSISLHEVEDPSPFGVVDLDETGRIRRFVEKPPRDEAPSRLINAGTWIFEPSLLARMDGSRFNRVEETLFADLAREGGGIVGFHQPARWADIGNAEALLRINLELAHDAASAATGSPLAGQAIAADVRVLGDAVIEAPSVIGTRSIIEPGACVSESLLWDDVHVSSGAAISGSILATGVHVGAGATVRNAVVAHGAVIEPGARVEDESVEPGARISAHPPRADRKATS